VGGHDDRSGAAVRLAVGSDERLDFRPLVDYDVARAPF
jgi:hypothetical protein